MGKTLNMKSSIGVGVGVGISIGFGIERLWGCLGLPLERLWEPLVPPGVPLSSLWLTFGCLGRPFASLGGALGHPWLPLGFLWPIWSDMMRYRPYNGLTLTPKPFSIKNRRTYWTDCSRGAFSSIFTDVNCKSKHFVREWRMYRTRSPQPAHGGTFRDRGEPAPAKQEFLIISKLESYMLNT